MIVLSVLICCFTISFLFWITFRPSKFPPGPRGLPLLGNLLSVKQWHPKLAYMGCMKLSKIYGNVAGFYIGPQPVVLISGFEACREAFMTESLNGRPDNPPARMKSRGKRMGLMLVDCEFWAVQRRFSLLHFREMGLGKQAMENLISQEIHLLLNRMKLSDPVPGPIQVKNYFTSSLINILWSMLASTRFSQEDPRLTSLIELMDFVSRSGDVVRAALPFPAFLLKMFPSFFDRIGRMDLMEQVWKFITEVIDEHRSNPSPNRKDFIDRYLNEVDDNPHNSFSEEQLMNILLDFFSAGTDTTSNSIGFALLYLIRYPDVQSRMQAEMDRVCGNGLPTLGHRSQLIYTQAVLMEVQRLSSVAPLGIPRRALQVTPFRGFIIPHDAYVILNYHSLHMDAEYWKDPEVFRPERHLDTDGQLVLSQHFIPFGAGKRSCVGESLARASYFLFTASLIKTFTFSSPPFSTDGDGVNGPLIESCLEPQDGFTLAHQPFRAWITRREE